MGTRLTFGDKLRVALDQREMGVRTLATLLAKSEPRRRESIRRRLNKYLLEGVNPTDGARQEIEDALDLGRDSLLADEEEEDPQLDAALMNVVRALGEYVDMRTERRSA